MTKKIVGGTVLTASDEYAADVIIEGDKITGIVQPGAGPADAETIDANGCYVMPGGIDAHTHLDMPFGGTTSADDFESGTVAAACGGTTTIVDFAIQQKGGTLRQALDTWHGKAEGKAAVDYGFHMIATDLPESELTGMKAIVDEGVTSFKMFMAYPNVLMLEDHHIFKAMLRASEIDALITMHAETGMPLDILIERALSEGKTAPIYHALTRPEVAEATGTERAIALAEMADVPVYIVHLSAAEALAEVTAARARGVDARAETCPQYLFLTAEDLNRDGVEGAKFCCSPPPRDAVDQEAIWLGLANDTFQVFSSDHAPYRFDDTGKLHAGPNPTFKQVANGVPGIELRAPLLFSEGVGKGRISLQRFVALTATNAAKIYGLHPRKGTIAIGADADIAIWDPQRKVTVSHDMLHDNVGYTPYEGMSLTGWPETVLCRGRLVVQDGEMQLSPGDGAFVDRTPGHAAALPTGKLVPELDPRTNFGAELL